MEKLDTIRNIGVIAHIDAGKTTTTESMLFYSGLTHRIGSIDDGTTVMDYLDEERARGITIIAAAATFPWHGSLIHLIDTPGHIDFTAEVERSLRVIDGAVVIFSGVEGVEAQSEKVWRQADNYRVPKIGFVNKLDRIGASFPRTLEQIRNKFPQTVVPLQEPVGIESDFNEVIDLIHMKLLQFTGENNEHLEITAIPDELADSAKVRREEMIELLADESDEIALAYLEGEGIEPDLLKGIIRKLTLDNRIVPILLGSAKNHIGVQPLMNAVVDFLPSPSDITEIPAFNVKTEEPLVVSPDPEAPFAGMIFKISASTSADLLYMRTYSGTLKKDMALVNSRTRDKIKAKQILRLYAKSTEALEQVGPGDIVGIIGPRDCGTGDTVCDPRHLLAFEKITFPDPVLSMAVEPRYTKEKDKLDQTLELLCREDPTLEMKKDEETGQRILAGMGELHLEINLKRLAEEFRVETKVGEPRVAYRETFRSACEQGAVFEKVLGDNELFASTKIKFRPLQRSSDETILIENALKNTNNIPKAYIRAAEKALQDGLRTGGAHGYPMIYAGAEIIELKVSTDKTTEGAVVGAVLMALDKAIAECGTKVLEPIMHLEILTPEDTVGEISTNLQPRRAIIHEMSNVGNIKRLVCEVPLAEMFGFGKLLPKLSGGRASFTMEPCGYQELPEDTAKKLFGYL